MAPDGLAPLALYNGLVEAGDALVPGGLDSAFSWRVDGVSEDAFQGLVPRDVLA